MTTDWIIGNARSVPEEPDDGELKQEVADSTKHLAAFASFLI